MYRACIHCSAPLGSNEALEAFPVGRTVAFDAARGRLWAVCAACGRWNLAPFEERWEALEQAEKRFADTRLRAQGENVGLARMPDGTELVRVGPALPGELAAWRYGDSLRARRERVVKLTGGAAAVGAGANVGLAVAAGLAGPLGGFALMGAAWGVMLGWLAFHARHSRPLARLSAEESPTGFAITIPRARMVNAALLPGARPGEIALHLSGWPTPLPDALSRRVLARAMVRVNPLGGGRKTVDEALAAVAGAPSPDAFVLGMAGWRPIVEAPPIWKANPMLLDPPPQAARGGSGPLGRTHALALEMALADETERRALEGELALLEAAWREAEAIAGIADRLATLPAAGQRAR